jgi:pyridoxal phosphate enzyme (YggS family)
MKSVGTVPPEKLARNLATVRERIKAALAKAGRPADSAKLVAVTKYVDAETVRALSQLGVACVCEARVQDAQKKVALLQPPKFNWHLIGHLQTNKAPEAVRLFQMVHSVDSLRVAEALDKERRKIQGAPALPCLLEVNVAGEESKFGLQPEIETLKNLLEACKGLSGLRIAGLMTMAPYSENPEETSRPVFKQLRQLRESLNALNCYSQPLTELSMGMTQDYEIAIEEGATLVRVGSALFE